MPPDVCNVAVDTAVAFPVALVSLVIAFAVAVPDDAAGNAVADSESVATAVPGADTVPAVLKTSFPDAPINAVTASVAAFLAAVECVTAMFYVSNFSNHFDGFSFACFRPFNL